MLCSPYYENLKAQTFLNPFPCCVLLAEPQVSDVSSYLPRLWTKILFAQFVLSNMESKLARDAPTEDL